MTSRGVRWVLILATASCSTPSPAPEFAEATSPPADGPDDPASCLTQSARAEKAWFDSANRALDERLVAFDRCAPAGGWLRQERFSQALKFAPDGTLAASFARRTSMSDCAAERCIAKAIDGVRVDAPPPGSDSLIHLDVVVNPKLPPRRPTANEYPLLAEDATECGPTTDAPKVTGRLPPEEVQSIIRSHYDEFRACYEQGLARTPTLTGRVNTRFVIERDGSVGKVTVTDSTLRDCKVVECIVGVYPNLKFPAPSGGIVTVIYPIVLEPG